MVLPQHSKFGERPGRPASLAVDLSGDDVGVVCESCCETRRCHALPACLCESCACVCVCGLHRASNPTQQPQQPTQLADYDGVIIHAEHARISFIWARPIEALANCQIIVASIHLNRQEGRACWQTHLCVGGVVVFIGYSTAAQHTQQHGCHRRRSGLKGGQSRGLLRRVCVCFDCRWLDAQHIFVLSCLKRCQSWSECLPPPFPACRGGYLVPSRGEHIYSHKRRRHPRPNLTEIHDM
jgi:hypothetical protein